MSRSAARRLRAVFLVLVMVAGALPPAEAQDLPPAPDPPTLPTVRQDVPGVGTILVDPNDLSPETIVSQLPPEAQAALDTVQRALAARAAEVANRTSEIRGLLNGTARTTVFHDDMNPANLTLNPPAATLRLQDYYANRSRLSTVFAASAGLRGDTIDETFRAADGWLHASVGDDRYALVSSGFVYAEPGDPLREDVTSYPTDLWHLRPVEGATGAYAWWSGTDRGGDPRYYGWVRPHESELVTPAIDLRGAVAVDNRPVRERVANVLDPVEIAGIVGDQLRHVTSGLQTQIVAADRVLDGLLAQILGSIPPSGVPIQDETIASIHPYQNEVSAWLNRTTTPVVAQALEREFLSASLTDVGDALLRVVHRHDFLPGADGGAVQISWYEPISGTWTRWMLLSPADGHRYRTLAPDEQGNLGPASQDRPAVPALRDVAVDALGRPVNPRGLGWTGNSEGWVESVFDLSQFAGKVIRLRFFQAIAQRQAGVPDDPHAGWTIDRVSVEAVSASVDVGVARILAPANAAVVDEGARTAVVGVVKNYGRSPVTAAVDCRIQTRLAGGTLVNQSCGTRTVALAPGRETLVTFPEWTARNAVATYKIQLETRLQGGLSDENPDNDADVSVVRSRRIVDVRLEDVRLCPVPHVRGNGCNVPEEAVSPLDVPWRVLVDVANQGNTPVVVSPERVRLEVRSLYDASRPQLVATLYPHETEDLSIPFGPRYAGHAIAASSEQARGRLSFTFTPPPVAAPYELRLILDDPSLGASDQIARNVNIRAVNLANFYDDLMSAWRHDYEGLRPQAGLPATLGPTFPAASSAARRQDLQSKTLFPTVLGGIPQSGAWRSSVDADGYAVRTNEVLEIAQYARHTLTVPARPNNLTIAGGGAATLSFSLWHWLQPGGGFWEFERAWRLNFTDLRNNPNDPHDPARNRTLRDAAGFISKSLLLRQDPVRFLLHHDLNASIRFTGPVQVSLALQWGDVNTLTQTTGIPIVRANVTRIAPDGTSQLLAQLSYTFTPHPTRDRGAYTTEGRDVVRHLLWNATGVTIPAGHRIAIDLSAVNTTRLSLRYDGSTESAISYVAFPARERMHMPADAFEVLRGWTVFLNRTALTGGVCTAATTCTLTEQRGPSSTFTSLPLTATTTPFAVASPLRFALTPSLASDMRIATPVSVHLNLTRGPGSSESESTIGLALRVRFLERLADGSLRELALVNRTFTSQERWQVLAGESVSFGKSVTWENATGTVLAAGSRLEMEVSLYSNTGQANRVWMLPFGAQWNMTRVEWGESLMWGPDAYRLDGFNDEELGVKPLGWRTVSMPVRLSDTSRIFFRHQVPAPGYSMPVFLDDFRVTNATGGTILIDTVDYNALGPHSAAATWLQPHRAVTGTTFDARRSGVVLPNNQSWQLVGSRLFGNEFVTSSHPFAPNNLTFTVPTVDDWRNDTRGGGTVLRWGLPFGGYRPDAWGAVSSPLAIDLTGTTDPKLVLRHAYGFAYELDGGLVQVAPSVGLGVGTWRTVHPLGALNGTVDDHSAVRALGDLGFTGQSAGIVNHTFDLSQFKGQLVRFRLLARSGDGPPEGDGWTIYEARVEDGRRVLFQDDFSRTLVLQPLGLPAASYYLGSLRVDDAAWTQANGTVIIPAAGGAMFRTTGLQQAFERAVHESCPLVRDPRVEFEDPSHNQTVTDAHNALYGACSLQVEPRAKSIYSGNFTGIPVLGEASPRAVVHSVHANVLQLNRTIDLRWEPGARLTFEQQLRIDGERWDCKRSCRFFDKAIVQVREVGAANESPWVTLTTFDQLHASASPEWRPFALNLDAFAGRQIELRFVAQRSPFAMRDPATLGVPQHPLMPGQLRDTINATDDTVRGSKVFTAADHHFEWLLDNVVIAAGDGTTLLADPEGAGDWIRSDPVWDEEWETLPRHVLKSHPTEVAPEHQGTLWHRTQARHARGTAAWHFGVETPMGTYVPAGQLVHCTHANLTPLDVGRCPSGARPNQPMQRLVSPILDLAGLLEPSLTFQHRHSLSFTPLGSGQNDPFCGATGVSNPRPCTLAGLVEVRALRATGVWTDWQLLGPNPGVSNLRFAFVHDSGGWVQQGPIPLENVYALFTDESGKPLQRRDLLTTKIQLAFKAINPSGHLGIAFGNGTGLDRSTNSTMDGGWWIDAITISERNFVNDVAIARARVEADGGPVQEGEAMLVPPGRRAGIEVTVRNLGTETQSPVLTWRISGRSQEPNPVSDGRQQTQLSLLLPLLDDGSLDPRGFVTGRLETVAQEPEPLPGAEVSLVVDLHPTEAATTDVFGEFAIPAPSFVGGIHTIGVRFGGNETYAPTNATEVWGPVTSLAGLPSITAAGRSQETARLFNVSIPLVDNEPWCTRQLNLELEIEVSIPPFVDENPANNKEIVKLTARCNPRARFIEEFEVVPGTAPPGASRRLDFTLQNHGNVRLDSVLAYAVVTRPDGSIWQSEEQALAPIQPGSSASLPQGIFLPGDELSQLGRYGVEVKVLQRVLYDGTLYEIELEGLNQPRLARSTTFHAKNIIQLDGLSPDSAATWEAGPSWEIAEVPDLAVSPPWLWRLGNGSVYAPNLSSSLVTFELLPHVARDADLVFSYLNNLHRGDSVAIECSTDDGRTWRPLTECGTAGRTRDNVLTAASRGGKLPKWIPVTLRNFGGRVTTDVNLLPPAQFPDPGDLEPKRWFGVTTPFAGVAPWTAAASRVAGSGPLASWAWSNSSVGLFSRPGGTHAFLFGRYVDEPLNTTPALARNSQARLVSPVVDLRGVTEPATLSFWHFYSFLTAGNGWAGGGTVMVCVVEDTDECRKDTEGKDAWMPLREPERNQPSPYTGTWASNSGGTFIPVGTPAFVASIPGWQRVGLRLDVLTGKDCVPEGGCFLNERIRIAFVGTTNATGDATGWWIDDIRVTGGVFESSPTLLRFRATTDEMFNEGSFAVDDLMLLGRTREHSVSARIATINGKPLSAFHAPDGVHWMAPGSPVRVGIEVRNDGLEPACDLVGWIRANRLPDNSLPPNATQQSFVVPGCLGPGQRTTVFRSPFADDVVDRRIPEIENQDYQIILHVIPLEGDERTYDNTHVLRLHAATVQHVEPKLLPEDVAPRTVPADGAFAVSTLLSNWGTQRERVRAEATLVRLDPGPQGWDHNGTLGWGNRTTYTGASVVVNGTLVPLGLDARHLTLDHLEERSVVWNVQTRGLPPGVYSVNVTASILNETGVPKRNMTSRNVSVLLGHTGLYLHADFDFGNRTAVGDNRTFDNSSYCNPLPDATGRLRCTGNFTSGAGPFWMRDNGNWTWVDSARVQHITTNNGPQPFTRDVEYRRPTNSHPDRDGGARFQWDPDAGPGGAGDGAWMWIRPEERISSTRDTDDALLSPVFYLRGADFNSTFLHLQHTYSMPPDAAGLVELQLARWVPMPFGPPPGGYWTFHSMETDWIPLAPVFGGSLGYGKDSTATLVRDAYDERAAGGASANGCGMGAAGVDNPDTGHSSDAYELWCPDSDSAQGDGGSLGLPTTRANRIPTNPLDGNRSFGLGAATDGWETVVFNLSNSSVSNYPLLGHTQRNVLLGSAAAGDECRIADGPAQVYAVCDEARANNEFDWRPPVPARLRFRAGSFGPAQGHFEWVIDKISVSGYAPRLSFLDVPGAARVVCGVERVPFANASRESGCPRPANLTTLHCGVSADQEGDPCPRPIERVIDSIAEGERHEFEIVVRNPGGLPDLVDLAFDFVGVAPPEWIEAGTGFATPGGVVDRMQVLLPPRSSRSIVVVVTAAVGLLEPEFKYEFEAVVRAVSQFDPMAQHSLRILLEHSTALHPDVVVEDVQTGTESSLLGGPTRSVYAGVPTLVTVQISNRGTAEARDVMVRLLARSPSGEETVVLGPTLAPVTRLAFLDAGGRTVSLPFTWTPRETGPHTIVVEAFLANAATREMSTRNNEIRFSIDVVSLPLPDLVVSSLQVLERGNQPVCIRALMPACEGPEGPVEGSVVDVLVRVQNAGRAPARGVQIDFSSDKDRFWIERVAEIPPGGSVDLRAPWRVVVGPDGQARKSLSVFAFLTGGGLYEPDLENNRVLVPVPVRTYDPRVSSEGLETFVVRRGSVVTFDVVVGARGNSDDRILLDVPNLPAGWAAIPLPERRMPVKVGADMEAQILLRLPEQTHAGPYPLTLVASSAFAPHRADRLAFTVEVEREEGFALHAPSEVVLAPGSTAVNVRVANLGNGLGDIATVSVLGAPAGWSVALDRTSLALDGFSVRNVTLNVTTPPGPQTPPGRYEIVVVGRLGELSQTVTIPVVVQGVVRVGVSTRDLPSTYRPGQSVDARLVLVHEGNVPGTVRLAAESEVALVSLGGSAFEMVPGQSLEVPASLTVPLGTPPGAHVVRWLVQAQGRTVAHPTSLLVEAPDLAFAAGELRPRNPAPGSDVRITLKAQNPTDVSVESATVSAYVNGILVGYKVIDLAPRGSRDVEFTWKAQPGRHVVTVLLDEAGDLVEISKENNALELSLEAADGGLAGLPGFEPILVALCAIAAALGRRRKP